MQSAKCQVLFPEADLKFRVHLKHASLIMLSAFFLSLLAGCNREGRSGDVMASVNGRKIYRSEVDRYFANQTAGSDQQPTGEQAVSLRLSILDTLIETEILMRRADKLGLLATDEEVDRKLNEMKSPFTAEQFNKRLEEKKLTVDDVAGYYNAHKSEFNFIEPQYRLSKIMVTGMPNPQVHNLQNSKAQNDADARKKIQMIANRLDSGDDFATLAMNYSEDPETSNNGGDLGLAPESALKNADPVTRDSVLKLKPGQYTPVLPLLNPANHQPYGYMIVKLVSKEAAGQRDLNNPSVQQAFRQQLRDRREQLLKAAYYETLRDDAKITNYYAEEVLKNAGTAK